MNRRRAWIIAVSALAALALAVVIVLLTRPDANEPGATTTTSPPTASGSSEPSPTATGSPEVTEVPDDESPDAEADGSDTTDPPQDEVGPAGAALCDRVTVATFEEITGLVVELGASSTREQCDYTIVDGPDGTFARVTQRPLDDHVSWDEYAVTQPDGPDVTRPDVADGAYVSVVDGGDVRYVTAEAGTGTTVVTWELALAAAPAEARDQATALLRAATEDRS